MIDPVSTLSIMANAAGIHSWFSGLHSGRDQKRLLEEVSRMRLAVERLTDHILYVPAIKEVRDLTASRRTQLEERQAIAELLGPLQNALQDEIVATAIIATPERLRTAFAKDPWEVLFSIRPIGKLKKPSDPDIIPVVFAESGLYYIGWQMRGALPGLLDCAYKPAIRVAPAPSVQLNPEDSKNPSPEAPIRLSTELSRNESAPTSSTHGQSIDRGGLSNSRLDDFLGFKFSWTRQALRIIVLTLLEVVFSVLCIICTVLSWALFSESAAGGVISVGFAIIFGWLTYAVHKERLREIAGVDTSESEGAEGQD
jgi:hypothetical protein